MYYIISFLLGDLCSGQFFPAADIARATQMVFWLPTCAEVFTGKMHAPAAKALVDRVDGGHAGAGGVVRFRPNMLEQIYLQILGRHEIIQRDAGPMITLRRAEDSSEALQDQADDYAAVIRRHREVYLLLPGAVSRFVLAGGDK